jgi:hypothetical protein
MTGYARACTALLLLLPLVGCTPLAGPVTEAADRHEYCSSDSSSISSSRPGTPGMPPSVSVTACENSQQLGPLQQQPGPSRAITGALEPLSRRQLLQAQFSNWSSLAFNWQTGQVFNAASDMLPNVNVYFLDGFDTPGGVLGPLVTSNSMYPICYLR